MSLDIRSGTGGAPCLQFRPEAGPETVWRVPVPVDLRFLGGDHVRGGYQEITGSAETRHGIWRLVRARREWVVRDTWSVAGPHHVHLDRVLSVGSREQPVAAGRAADGGTGGHGAAPPGGDAFHLRLAIGLDGDAGTHRPFVPANLYEQSQLPAEGVASFSDARLSYPLVAAYDQMRRSVLLVLRGRPARYDEGPRRRRGQREFAHATDIGSMYIGATPAGIGLGADFPYYEGDRSAALDSLGSPARAYHPVGADGAEGAYGAEGGTGGERTEFQLSYDVIVGEAADFSAAVRWSLDQAVRISPPRPVTLPFTLGDAVGLRLRSGARTYSEWEGGAAGFRLNFDPERGYDVPARAFGASFTEHSMQGALDILEYGFTGRQLNLAWALARGLGGDWLDRGRRVCDFFVRCLTTPSGFVYSHYDVARRRPLFSVGDPDGAVLHYLGTSGESGSYLRLMTEAGSDLLLNWELHTRAGHPQPHWLSAALRLGDFLVRCQNPDGSWYRAYTPAGEGIRGGTWLGDEDGAKSATTVAIPFLIDLALAGGRARVTADGGAEPAVGANGGRRYVETAERAGRFIMEHHVAGDHYRGGTLDNPNVIDKESALLSMSALLSLHRYTGDGTQLAAAERAARLGVSWTSLWDVPPLPGTPLGRARVRSAGWGGINSIWGTGVGDIYSLFFLTDLLELAELTGDGLFASIAHLTARGTAQILSHPGEMFGFAGTGMQPEGIAFCDQGADDGLITKGSTWGGLGWIYTAGTYGLGRYLEWLADATAAAG
jgi:hypothetical protein